MPPVNRVVMAALIRTLAVAVVMFSPVRQWRR